MARKTKTLQVEIDGKETSVEIRELSVGEIIKLTEDDTFFEKSEGGEKVLRDFAEAFDSRFLKLCTNLKTEDFKKMFPSDLKEVWDTFKEVNSVFFDVAQKVGLMDMVEKIKGDLLQAIQEDFLGSRAGLLKLGMSESLNTDTPI